MRTLLLFWGIVLTLQVTAQQKDFPWLNGLWKLENKNSYESWSTGNELNSLYGISYQVNGADTLVTEKIKLTAQDGFFYYIPDVAGDQAPVLFKITKHDASSFVAENPSHDFPKVIRYTFFRKENHDTIQASIEGDGKITLYTFVRVK